MKKKIILFVCKGNRYKSRIAEEIFNKNPPKNFTAQSVGVTYQKHNDRSVPKALEEVDTHKEVELWQIKDCHAGDINCMRGGRKRIEKMVENLVKSLQ